MSLKIASNLVGTRRFVPLTAASSLGTFNDNMFKTALLVLIQFFDLSVGDLPPDIVVPIAATCFTLPLFLFSAIAGQLADRYDRASIMKRAKFAEVGLMMIAAAGLILNSGPILLITLFLMGTQSAFYSPSRVASMPHYFKPNELVVGNAVFGACFFLFLLLGQLGGTLLPDMANGRIILGGVLIIMALLGWVSILAAPPSPAANPGLKIRWNFIWETGRVLWQTAHHPRVLRPLLAIAWFWLVTAALTTLMPRIVGNILGEGAPVLALFNVLFVIGAATGSLVCGALSRGREAIMFTIIGGFALAVFSLDIAWQLSRWEIAATPVGAVEFARNPANWRLLADLFLSSIAAGMFIVPLQAMAQRRAPEDMRARLMAAGNLLNALGASLGQLGLILLGVFSLPIATAFVVLALGTAAIALASLRYLPAANSQS